MSQRVHYIDALRVLAVALLVPFHAARVFDVWDPFYAKSGQLSQPLSWFIAVVGIAHMPLLFVLAGASTYFALGKRTGAGYAGERSRRLLIPLVFGTLVLVPAQTWIGAVTNSGYRGNLLQWWPNFFVLRTDRPDYLGSFTPAHLWFILFLFVISMATLPLLRRWRSRAEGCFASRAAAVLGRPAWWALPPLALLVAEGLPDIAGKNPFTYGVYFVLGYVTMAEPSFMDEVERHRHLALALAVGGTAALVFVWPIVTSLPDPSFGRAVGTLFMLETSWVTVLAAFGYGKHHFDRPSAVLAYSSEASYPFYILHQTVIVVLGFYLLELSLGVWPTYLLLVGAAFVVTVGLYELVRRTSVTRFLFGMRPLPKPSSPGPTPKEAAA
jgi:peptidoglycan/LPS O-acetylase OafA/YrhL